MIKYPSLKYPNHEKSAPVFADGEIVVQEKIDGANFRLSLEENLDSEYHTEDRDLVFGSRNIQFKNVKDENDQFTEVMEYCRDTIDVESLRDVQDEFGELTLFGEAMNPHTLSYNFENIPLFVGFDVFDEVEGRWLGKSKQRTVFDACGVEMAPVIDTVPADDWNQYDPEYPESEFGDVTAEGLVLKNYDTQRFSKLVRDEFKEKMKKTFNSKPDHEEPGHRKLAYEYVPNARIEKQVYKLRDEGPWDSIQMEMMAPRDDHPGLAECVIRDMVDEEASAIFMNENYEVDLGEFRSHVNSRCATVLRRMVQEAAVESRQE